MTNTQSQTLTKRSEAELLAQIEAGNSSQALWVFDCDGTLIHGDIASITAWAVIRMGMAHTELLPPEYEHFKSLPFDYPSFRKLRDLIIQRLGINAIYEWEAFLHSGLPAKTSHEIATFALKEGIKTKHMAFTSPVSDLARKHAHQCWIVSGSPDMCVWAVADELKVPHDRVIGTRLETVDGIFANRIMAPGIIWEELKRVALHDKKVFDPYFVAGDTIGDWAMFEMSTHWAWCTVWGKYRHRGEEIRTIIQDRVLGANGPQLPTEPGIYTYQTKDHPRNWVFEILGNKYNDPDRV